MKRKTLLLIGAGGFLGQSLIPVLLREGWAVDVLIRDGVLDLPSEVNVFLGGLNNCELLRRILPSYTAVIHLASGTTPGVSAQVPALEADLNISPTLRFLEVLQSFPEIHLIYISSGGTVYGDPANSPISEDTMASPLSYYGAGKAAVELFLQTYARTFRGNVTILRPSNLYGPRQPRYHGFGIIRTMLQHALDDTTIEIWGDGENVRDFIYIDDLVQACLAVISGKPTRDRVFNVGSGIGYSLNQLFSVIESVCGTKLAVTYSPERKIDVRRVVLDSSRLTANFGWVPQTTIEDGIRQTWHWLKRSNQKP